MTPTTPTYPTTPTDPPVLLVDRAADLPFAIAGLTEAGWTARPDFSLPDEPWDLTRRRWACHGAVSDAAAAVAATLALVRGCALIVAPGPGAPREFLDDLRRAGRVQAYTSSRPQDERLDPVESALLELLADGHSIQQAAAQLYLSGRTAQRRLMSARAALGVRSTREAVVVWTKLNRRPRPGG